MAVKKPAPAADKGGMQERRSQGRIMCADIVEVSWKDRAGRGQIATAILEDISPSGACLQFESPVPLGVELSWKSPGQRLAGWVRYCNFHEIGYFVGIEFLAGSAWSRRAYRPCHLFDPEMLLAMRSAASAGEHLKRKAQ
jgi:hypothetical protein